MGYQTVIVGTDFQDESKAVIERAKSIADDQIYLVHVLEPLSFSYGAELPVDLSGLDDAITQQAHKKMKELGQTWNIPETHQKILHGRPERELQCMAKEANADVIVVGTHGKHGLALLLGSTSNGVLHGSPCDVLAVKV